MVVYCRAKVLSGAGDQGTSEGWVAELPTGEPKELFGVRRGPWQSKMAKKCTAKRAAEWAEAKRKCRLNAETLRMAKELGLNPRSLIKNIPSNTELWKAPVHVWIREMYERRGPHGHPDTTQTARNQQRSLVGKPVVNTQPEHGGAQRGRQGRAAEPDPISYPAYPPDCGLAEDAFSCFEEGGWFDTGEPNEEETATQNESMLQRREHFRIAADRVATVLSSLPFVRKVVLFGSVAAPLVKEVPRFREFRRAGIEVWHESKDIDLAVWLDDLSDLRRLQRARSQALSDLLRDLNIGVAHHQVEIFIFDAGADRYLGRLCCFAQCPKGKPECEVAGCGTTRFLKQHEGFTFRSDALAPDRAKVLYDRDSGSGGEVEDNEIPF